MLGVVCLSLDNIHGCPGYSLLDMVPRQSPACCAQLYLPSSMGEHDNGNIAVKLPSRLRLSDFSVVHVNGSSCCLIHSLVSAGLKGKGVFHFVLKSSSAAAVRFGARGGLSFNTQHHCMLACLFGVL